MNPRVLIAAGDPPVQTRLAALLSGSPAELVAARPLDVLNLLIIRPSLRLLILVESRDDGTGSLDLLVAARERRPDVAVLLLSDHPTVERATEAIRHGAEDFVPIPFSEDVLLKEVGRILETAELRERLKSFDGLLPRPSGFDRIVSRSACMRRVFELAIAASRSDTPVLITGETGTGKELLARAIHETSRRERRNFVPVNCAALPRELLESELFGHRRGAFTGAHADYAGLFAAADGGTLFLDEIGELPPEAQPKLLRVLQDGEVRPVGGLDSRKVDVRIIAASNRSLQAMSQGLLRQDLFFRLSVVVIHLPPLRDRLDDLPLLVQTFLFRLRARGITIESIDPQALDLLSQYPFPGNVRELENLVEGTAVVLPGDRTTISAEDVRGWLRRRGLAIHTDAAGGVLPLRLEELEAWAIREALRRTHGNKRQAALLLGISRDTLYRKLEDLDIDRPCPSLGHSA